MGLIIVGFGFLGLLFAILLFDWLMKRWTGYGVFGSLEDREINRKELDYLKKHNFYDEEKSTKRKSKATPHYDALVNAEWEAANSSRLEDAAPKSQSDEPKSFGELLEDKQKKS